MNKKLLSILSYSIYTLIGINLLSNCNDEKEPEIEQDKTTYTVTFNTDGGKETILNQVVKWDSIPEKPTSPIKEGYIFLNWVDSSTPDDGEYSFDKALNKDTELLAKWSEGTVENKTLGLSTDFKIGFVHFRGKGGTRQITDGFKTNFKTHLNGLYKELSYGKFQISKVDFIDDGEKSYSAEEIRKNATSSSYIFQAATTEGNENKTLTEIVPIAQKKIDDLHASGQAANYGVVITKIDTSLITKLEGKEQLKEYSVTGLILSLDGAPTSLNVENYDLVVFAFEDENEHGGGAQTYFEFNPIKQGDKTIDVSKPYVTAGVTKAGLADLYPNVKFKFLDAERIIGHEIVHGLGIGTHDCGLTISQAEADLFYNQQTTDFYSKYNYGDKLSLMGDSEWGLSLAPSSKIYLGWLDDSRINTVTTNKTNIEIKEYSETSGVVLVKIPVTFKGKAGHLFVSYTDGSGYQSNVLEVAGGKNTKGLLIHYAETSTSKLTSLETSLLVDADKKMGDEIVALQPNASFSFIGVTIDNVVINGKTATFNVTK